jgi:hypothetical protein
VVQLTAATQTRVQQQMDRYGDMYADDVDEADDTGIALVRRLAGSRLRCTADGVGAATGASTATALTRFG